MINRGNGVSDARQRKRIEGEFDHLDKIMSMLLHQYREDGGKLKHISNETGIGYNRIIAAYTLRAKNRTLTFWQKKEVLDYLGYKIDIRIIPK